ncbi:MAG: AAA family ATPase [Candidatus Hodarchaeales archaeon]|jgi:replication factor C subunit 2/4
MNLPFLKKYQPKRYDDFVIDKEYIQLLKTLIKMNNLNILLIGDAGTGKTSLIEATIREYYQLDKIPKNNVLYINSLQEQGISYYRNEVKTFCQTSSGIQGKKKFIILDDIDVINEQSQQVFRNCIDKYSHKVHFLASCSNIQKTIESIQSRCTLIKLKQNETNLLKKIIQRIKQNEAINITLQAEKFIMNICNNSIRLLINYLEKFSLLNEKITLDMAKKICTNISFYDFERYTNAWYINKSLSEAIKIIYNICDKGYSVMDILDSYFQFIKISESIDETNKYKIIRQICQYISYFHTLHEHEIELVFFTDELIRTVNSN